MWNELLDQLGRFYDGAGHHRLLTRIWNDERWFDTPRQRAAAETVCEALRAAGLVEAQVVPFAADGRTRFQDWTTKLAWECRSARVAVDGEILADREQVPWATVMASGPLPETRARVVDLDRLERVDRASVGGCFVFGSQPPLTIKTRVQEHGALAVLSDFIGRTTGADEHTTKWCNAWSEGAGGWYVHHDDAPMPGFCLSPAAGKRLRELMGQRPDLRLTAHCDSRIYAGESHCVTAVIPGRDRAREIWIFGHACEPGANDNTSGVATLVEVARMLRRAMDAGEIAQPLCSIRVIATEECLGMLAFATQHPELARRALASINVDTVGDRAEAERPHGLFYGPLASPTLVWSVAGVFGRLVMERAAGEWNLRTSYQMPSADDMIADPNCGVPNVWIGRGNDGVGYHSSGDTPDICLPTPLRCNALLVAATAQVMADLDRRWSAALLDPVSDWIAAHLLPATEEDSRQLRRWAAAAMLRDALRWGVPGAAVEPWALRYATADAPPLPGLPTAGPVYRRRTWGTANFETVPAGQPRFSCWSAAVNGILYWTDGRRCAAAIDRLVAAELGGPQAVAAAAVLESCVAGGTAERIR